MMDLQTIWGSDEHLNALQMSARACCMFFIALALIRIGGMRIFGLKSAFDSILVIMLGAILARGVVGASPFLSTVAAGFVMVLIHRLFSYLSTKYIWIGKIVKGEHHRLYKNESFNEKRMLKHGISKDDMLEAVRRELNTTDINEVDEIRIEKSGELSVTRKKEI
jgi:uncharacterized membrane protein YcaP (DUF421 family)